MTARVRWEQYARCGSCGTAARRRCYTLDDEPSLVPCAGRSRMAAKAPPVCSDKKTEQLKARVDELGKRIRQQQADMRDQAEQARTMMAEIARLKSIIRDVSKTIKGATP